MLSNRRDSPPSLMVSMGSSAVAPAIAAFFTNPADVAKTRLNMARELQAPTSTAQGVIGCLRTIYRLEGLAGLQRGLGLVCIREASKNSFRIGLYEPLVRKLEGPSTASSTPSQLTRRGRRRNDRRPERTHMQPARSPQDAYSTGSGAGRRHHHLHCTSPTGFDRGVRRSLAARRRCQCGAKLHRNFTRPSGEHVPEGGSQCAAASVAAAHACVEGCRLRARCLRRRRHDY